MEETMETEPAGPTTSFTKNAVSDIIGPHPAADPSTHAPQGLRAMMATDKMADADRHARQMEG